MKVELLKTLKGNTETWLAGEVFVEPFPEEIISEIALDRGVVRVIDAPAPPPPPTKEPERDRTEGLQLDEALAAIEEVEEGKPPPKVEQKEKAPPKKKAPVKRPTLAKRKKT
jgi:hypothetical protein